MRDAVNGARAPYACRRRSPGGPVRPARLLLLENDKDICLAVLPQTAGEMRCRRTTSPCEAARSAQPSDRQTCPSFGPARIDDGATTAGFHAHEKAVRARAAGFGGLVSAFHVLAPVTGGKSRYYTGFGALICQPPRLQLPSLWITSGLLVNSVGSVRSPSTALPRAKIITPAPMDSFWHHCLRHFEKSSPGAAVQHLDPAASSAPGRRQCGPGRAQPLCPGVDPGQVPGGHPAAFRRISTQAGRGSA